MTDNRTKETNDNLYYAESLLRDGSWTRAQAETSITIAKELRNIRECLDEVINQLRARP